MSRIRTRSMSPAPWATMSLALCLVSGSASAQFSTGGLAAAGDTNEVGGAPFLEAWVDPEVAALNMTLVPPIFSAAGCPDQPFATIQAAIAAIAVPSAATPGLVHVMPGIYGPVSAGGNGEIFPIQMRENVSVQGLSARACVLRGDGSSPLVQAFVPVIPFGDRVPSEILTDFSFLGDPEYVEFMDGFTFQGGDIQLYAEPEEVDSQWRVSNCVFDMLDGSDVGVEGPEFGILIVHTYDLDYEQVKGPKGEPMNLPGYHDVEAHVINNTFIQGWHPASEGEAIVATETSVAICDVANTLWNDPLFPNAVPDVFPELRGVGNPNIQNNLIRALDEAPRTALMGIDDADTRVVIALPVPPPGGSPSNAFDPTQAVDMNGAYNSQIVQSGTGVITPPVAGVVPQPAVIPNASQGGRDPGFVGEMLGQLLGVPIEFARDWRILVTSTLFDAGFSPDQGILQALNGTGYDDAAVASANSIFDFDGEGYGNVRLRFFRPDIGFDELDLIAMCAHYANDTIVDPTITAEAGVQCPGTPPILPLASGFSAMALSPLPANIFLAQASSQRPYNTLGIPYDGLCNPGVPAFLASSAHIGSLVPSIAGLIFVDVLLPLNDPQLIPTFFPGFGVYAATSFRGNFVPRNDPMTFPFPIHALDVPPAAGACTMTVEQGHWIDAASSSAFFTNLQTTQR